MAVCSKCIFHQHNGHDLCQLDDIVKHIVTQLTALNSQVDHVIKEQEECKQAMASNKEEIEKKREKQVLIINRRFQDIFKKLEDRKTALTKEIISKFDNALFKAGDRMKNTAQYGEEIVKML